MIVVPEFAAPSKAAVASGHAQPEDPGSGTREGSHMNFLRGLPKETSKQAVPGPVEAACLKHAGFFFGLRGFPGRGLATSN